jgi:uracil-DNA glycosylase family 4
MSKVTELDVLKQQILEDGVTPELATSATQLVFGDGNYDADIVFIGEAPGKKEDEQGIPFVGASGKFLNEMLDMIGLKRDDVYITNIVKYRPPENRDPKPEEKKAFLPYLQRQLEIIQPKVVVTLGRHSMNCFLPDLQISKVHGEPKRIQLSHNKDSNNTLPIVILPLYHPAAALYNPLQHQTLIDDFAKIPAIIKKINAN